MNLKRKGINAERELIHLFWAKKPWVAIRVASSGAMKYPSPDVLAANGTRQLAIECKSTKNTKYYISKKQVDELREFSNKFGAESWIAIRFLTGKWFFFSLDDLKEKKESFAITRKQAELTGLNFDDLTS